MSIMKPYSYYFKNTGFDVKQYINDMTLNCIQNNIDEPEKCALFNNLEPSHPDYKELFTKFNETKESKK